MAFEQFYPESFRDALRHSGLDPESSLLVLDSRSPITTLGDKLRGNDGIGISVKK